MRLQTFLLSACFIQKEFPGTVRVPVQAVEKNPCWIYKLLSIRWSLAIKGHYGREAFHIPSWVLQAAGALRPVRHLPFFSLSLFFSSGSSESAGVFSDIALQCHYRELQYAASGTWSI